MSARRRGTFAAITLSIVIAGLLTADPSSAAPAPAHVRWTSETVPVAEASLFNAVQLDGHTTWVYGLDISDGYTPLLLAKDDRDGRGWTVRPTASVAGGGRINSISVRSPRDAWLVSDYGGSVGGVLTEHWDGAGWRAVPAPVPTNLTGGGLLSVSATAPGEVWAVGWIDILDSSEPDPNKPGGVIQVTHTEPLLEGWDGAGWSRVPLPDETGSVLQAVTAVSRNDVWAAGSTSADQPLMMHFDGHVWATVSLPYTGVYGEVAGFAGVSKDNVWAVGRSLVDEHDAGHALVAHWDGRHWQQVATPADAGQLWNATAVPGGIAVVGSTVTNQDDGYAMRLVGNRWQPLDIPSDGTAHRGSNGILWTAGKLTVVGASWSDASPSLTPLMLTTRD